MFFDTILVIIWTYNMVVHKDTYKLLEEGEGVKVEHTSYWNLMETMFLQNEQFRYLKNLNFM